MHSGMQGVVCNFGDGSTGSGNYPRRLLTALRRPLQWSLKRARSVRDELLKACLKKEES